MPVCTANYIIVVLVLLNLLAIMGLIMALYNRQRPKASLAAGLLGLFVFLSIPFIVDYTLTNGFCPPSDKALSAGDWLAFFSAYLSFGGTFSLALVIWWRDTKKLMFEREPKVWVNGFRMETHDTAQYGSILQQTDVPVANDMMTLAFALPRYGNNEVTHYAAQKVEWSMIGGPSYTFDRKVQDAERWRTGFNANDNDMEITIRLKYDNRAASTAKEFFERLCGGNGGLDNISLVCSVELYTVLGTTYTKKLELSHVVKNVNRWTWR